MCWQQRQLPPLASQCSAPPAQQSPASPGVSPVPPSTVASGRARCCDSTSARPTRRLSSDCWRAALRWPRAPARGRLALPLRRPRSRALTCPLASTRTGPRSTGTGSRWPGTSSRSSRSAKAATTSIPTTRPMRPKRRQRACSRRPTSSRSLTIPAARCRRTTRWITRTMARTDRCWLPSSTSSPTLTTVLFRRAATAPTSATD